MSTLLWTAMNGLMARTWILLVALMLALALAVALGALDPNDAFATVRSEEVTFEAVPGP